MNKGRGLYCIIWFIGAVAFALSMKFIMAAFFGVVGIFSLMKSRGEKNA